MEKKEELSSAIVHRLYVSCPALTNSVQHIICCQCWPYLIRMTWTKWVMLCNTKEGSEEHHAYLVPMWPQWGEEGGGLCFWGDTWFLSAHTDQQLPWPHKSPGKQLRLASFQELCLALPIALLTWFELDLRFAARLTGVKGRRCDLENTMFQLCPKGILKT